MNSIQNSYISRMISACEKEDIKSWNIISSYAENEFRSMLLMLDWLNNMKQNHEMTTEQARIHIDIQKNTMRTRLMALPDVTIVEAEHIINHAIDSIRKDLYNKMEWVII